MWLGSGSRQPQEALETTLFRAPVFHRRLAADEGVFLLIRSAQGGYSMREVTEYLVVGQQEPHLEVYQPQSDRCCDFEERAVIFSLQRQRKDNVAEGAMRVSVKVRRCRLTLSNPC